MAASAGDETALKCAYQQGKKTLKNSWGMKQTDKLIDSEHQKNVYKFDDFFLTTQEWIWILETMMAELLYI